MIDCQEEVDKDFSEFACQIKKVKGTRVHKVKNSYGVYDGFKYYRKNKPKESQYVLTESQYFSIIRKINKLLGELLINGNDVTLPYRLGRLEVRKYNATITIHDNKIKTNLPIDWYKTLKLWYEDKESYKNKTLIKAEEKELYKIYYNRNLARYNNKSYYQFTLNRELKKKLKQNIKEGKVDAFLI